MTMRNQTSHADRDVVESFLERRYLVVEGKPSAMLIGDLLMALGEDCSDIDGDATARGTAPEP